jgi:hypothetical protein
MDLVFLGWETVAYVLIAWLLEYSRYVVPPLETLWGKLPETDLAEGEDDDVKAEAAR